VIKDHKRTPSPQPSNRTKRSPAINWLFSLL
jgi:hypothetical protein